MNIYSYVLYNYLYSLRLSACSVGSLHFQLFLIVKRAVRVGLDSVVYNLRAPHCTYRET